MITVSVTGGNNRRKSSANDSFHSEFVDTLAELTGRLLDGQLVYFLEWPGLFLCVYVCVSEFASVYLISFGGTINALGTQPNLRYP